MGKREKLKKYCLSEKIRNIMERIPRPETLVRRRSQRVSNGSNFEADFKMLQDSDDDCVVSNDSGMELDENKFRGLSCGEIKQQVFSLGRTHRMRNTPPRVDSSATPADSESSPPTSPVSSRGKRFAMFDSPNTPRSLVRRLSQGKDSPARWQRKGVRMSRSPVCGVEQPVNVNPFTPNNRNNQSCQLNSAKRLRYSREISSRYKSDFVEQCKIGVGEFGDVFKVQNRLDGCIYAIKKTKNPIRGSRAELKAVREVCAHAVLDKHENVVRYYSAWSEGDRMLIQSEYCEGGSLADEISRRQKNFPQVCLSDSEIISLLTDAGEGLGYIHAQNLAHLDIKPPNILRSIKESKIVYKIGDLGHVSPFDERNFEEGDCRYTAKELIQSNEAVKDLRPADVFSLGLSAFEAATLVELQKNGDQWQLIRSPKFHLAFKETSHFLSKSTVDLILRMSCENPKDRIPAEKISKFLKQEEITLLKREVQYEKNTANQLRSQLDAIFVDKSHGKLQRLKTC